MKTAPNPPLRPGVLPRGNEAHYSAELLGKAHAGTDTVLADGFAPGRRARVCSAPAAILAAVGDHAAVLRDPDPGGEDLVCAQVWRMIICMLLGTGV